MYKTKINTNKRSSNSHIVYKELRDGSCITIAEIPNVLKHSKKVAKIIAVSLNGHTMTEHLYGDIFKKDIKGFRAKDIYKI